LKVATYLTLRNPRVDQHEANGADIKVVLVIYQVCDTERVPVLVQDRPNELPIFLRRAVVVLAGHLGKLEGMPRLGKSSDPRCKKSHFEALAELQITVLTLYFA
jgi:hypothetical protein